jgi:hypothetical protein
MEASIRKTLGQNYECLYNRAQCYWALYGEYQRHYIAPEKYGKQRRGSRRDLGNEHQKLTGSRLMDTKEIHESYLNGTMRDEDYLAYFNANHGQSSSN